MISVKTPGMTGTEQGGKRRRRFFATRLGIEEEDEEFQHANQSADGASRERSSHPITALRVTDEVPIHLSQEKSSTQNNGFSWNGLDLDMSTLPLGPLSWDAAPSPSETVVLRRGSSPRSSSQPVDALFHSAVDDGAAQWWLATSHAIPSPFQPVHVSFDQAGARGNQITASYSTSDTLDLGIDYPRDHNTDGLQRALSILSWDNSDSVVIGDPCWQTLFHDLQDCSFSAPTQQPPTLEPSASQAAAAAFIVNQTPSRDTGSHAREKAGRQEPARPTEQPRVQCSGAGTDINRHDCPPPLGLVPLNPSLRSKAGPTAGSCTSRQRLGRKPDPLQRAAPSRGMPSIVQAPAKSGQAGAQAGQERAAAASESASASASRPRVLGREGADATITKRIPSTSWMLLGGHMWEKGIIPDLVSLTEEDESEVEEPAGGAAEKGKQCKETSVAMEGCLQLAHPVATSGPQASSAQTPVLSEGLAITIGCLQEMDGEKRRKLGGGSSLRASTAHDAVLPVAAGRVFSSGPVQIRSAPGLQGSGSGLGMRRLVEQGCGEGLAGGGGTRISMSACPRNPAGSGLKDNMIGRLLQAAGALENGNKAQFLDLCALVKPHSHRMGTASQRAVYWILHSLTLRAEGQGVAFLKKPSRLSVKEAEKCLLWHYSSLPNSLFAFTCNVSEVIPKLVGKPRIHLVIVGDNMIPFLPILIRLLASQTQYGRLQALRVTTISYFKVLWRYGKNLMGLRDPSRAARVLSGVAAELGLEFAHQGMELEDDNMELLRTVERNKGEPVAVIMADSLKNAPDSVGSERSLGQ